MTALVPALTTVRPPRARVGRWHQVRGSIPSYLMLAPFLTVYLVFVIAPIALTLALSFSRWNGVTAPSFVGTENYREVFRSHQVLHAFKNLLVYVAIDVPLGMLVGLLLALLVNRVTGRWSGAVRSLLFFPFIMPLFITALIWTWMLDPSFGLVNQMLNALGMSGHDWLHNPTYMIPALIIIDIWHSAGFNMLLLLAGLKAVSADTLEAARLDGANIVQETYYVVLPQLRPVFFVVTVNALISAFQVFDLPWLVTRSGPTVGAGGPYQALLFPVMVVVQRGLGALRFGDAAVIGVALLALIAAVTAVAFVLRSRWEDA